jgi:hypothetical protein
MRLVITKHNRPTRQTWSILYRLALLQLSMTIANLRLAKTREVYCQRKVTGEEIMATKVEIRASAKSLCFQACTDCMSADECDPDENWIEEARAALETNEIKSKSK